MASSSLLFIRRHRHCHRHYHRHRHRLKNYLHELCDQLVVILRWEQFPIECCNITARKLGQLQAMLN